MIKKKLVLPISHRQSHKNIVWIQPNINNKLTDLLSTASKKIAIITDHNVKKLHSKALLRYLRAKKNRVLLLSLRPGENSKSLENYQTIIEKLLQAKCDRDTTILALGGGVVGDIAGFIASTYMRGISYIQIPTTLLAMVDSSIGSKTGINTPSGKNFIGTFWHAENTLINLNFLSSLPEKHYINGLFEIVKIFAVYDKDSFNYLKNNLIKILARDMKTISELTYRAIKLKIKITQKDPHEKNMRMILNFGHTIGHALEKISDYKMLHGYAVGYGMLFEAKIAVSKNVLASKDFNKIESILHHLGIRNKTLQKYNIDKLINFTFNDKKNRNNEIQYVLLKNIGRVHSENNNYAHPVSKKIVRMAFKALIGDKL